MTTVGCDVGLTSTTFHGSPLNPLCSAAAAFAACAQGKQKQHKRPPVTFTLTFRLSFGINASLRIHTQQRARVPSECNQLTQDHARAQISALSKPGSRWCCNNTDKSEHTLQKKWEEETGETETGVQTHRR